MFSNLGRRDQERSSMKLEDLGYPRKIACKRCRRRKKKASTYSLMLIGNSIDGCVQCDHERPICGECRKTRSECTPSSPVRTPVDSPAK